MGGRAIKGRRVGKRHLHLAPRYYFVLATGHLLLVMLSLRLVNQLDLRLPSNIMERSNQLGVDYITVSIGCTVQQQTCSIFSFL